MPCTKERNDGKLFISAFLFLFMKYFIIIFLVLMCPFVMALDTSLSEVQISMNVSGELELKNYRDISNLRINFSFYPRNLSTQEVQNSVFYPEGKHLSNHTVFIISHPEEKVLFGHYSEIKSQMNTPRVGDVYFPLKDFYEKYTEPTENIDSNDSNIVALSTRLAEGETETNHVVFKLANWTINNINYSLSTLTSDVSQPSSWVLEKKQGVCDEITNLFIAMCRSLNVPARFVSGISYTDSPLFEHNWGPHSWAEVYMPGHGWVPYDLTYKQLGWVDSSHIVLGISRTSQDIETSFNWMTSGSDTNVISNGLGFDVDVLDKRGKQRNLVHHNLSVIRESVGFGSYNVVIDEITNPMPYYQVIETVFVPTNGLSYINDKRRMVLLPPNSTNKVFLHVRVTEELDDDYRYTYPVNVEDSFGNNATTSFVVERQSQKYRLGELVNEGVQVNKNPGNASLSFNCNLPSRAAMGKGEIVCTLENIGNRNARDVKICYKECKNLDVPMLQEKEVTFDLGLESAGEKEVFVNLVFENQNQQRSYPVEIFDEPRISIWNVSTPRTIRWGEMYNVTLMLGLESYSVAENVSVIIDGRDDFSLGVIEGRHQLTIDMDSRFLNEGLNEVPVKIKYYDNQDNLYVNSTSYRVNVDELTFWQRIKQFFLEILDKMLGQKPTT